MTSKEKIRITEVDFFDGIFAVAFLRGYKSLFLDIRFEEDIAKIFQEFKEYAEQKEAELPFRILLHPIHGDSTTIHNGILSAMQRGVITLDSPGNMIIRIKLTEGMAKSILNEPAGRLFAKFDLKIIDILTH